ncbi:MAG: DUF3575 domain-containing protein [Duncaniella sp.]|nr:DUF3575 domain-containing protein [Duncaniella sp.]
MNKFLICCLAALSGLLAFGQVPADSAKVYFRMGHRHFDPAFNGNGVSIQPFIDHVKQADSIDGIERLVVRAYASPDGVDRANTILTRNRCKSITDYLLSVTGVDSSLIQSIPEGVAWGELRRMVAANPDVPSREKVLDILDNTPLWVFDENNVLIDGRKKQLMSLDYGNPYRWMYEHIFPELRNAVAVSLYLKEDVTPLPESNVASTAPAAPEITSDASEQSVASASSAPSDLSDESDPSEPSELDNHEPIHRFALKTNILYWAALMPNIELEWRINPRWSLALEGNVAWWHNDRRHKYYQIAMISPEARFHPIVKGPWHGLYTGAFVGGGWFDLENGGKGYYGEAGLAGLSVGYQWPIARNWSLEAGLGLGYMYSRYKEYIPHDDHYLYQRTKSLNYFGPLKVKFAIAWRFNDINKPKKVIPTL